MAATGSSPHIQKHNFLSHSVTGEPVIHGAAWKSTCNHVKNHPKTTCECLYDNMPPVSTVQTLQMPCKILRLDLGTQDIWV